MRISLVIVYGSGRDAGPLVEALASLRAQSRPPDETVLVLNGAALPEPVAAHTGVRFVRLPEDTGCPAGRNAGARAATGDILVFMDDDGRLDSGALAAIESALQRWPDRTALAGRVVDRTQLPKMAPPDAIDTVHFSGGVFAISRVTFLECGGYCEHALRQGEELDLALKLLKRGTRIRRLRDFVLYHPVHVRGWASDEILLGTVNTVRVFWTHLPVAAAAAGTVWKIGGHAAHLLREGRPDRLAELAVNSARAAATGLRQRDALGWRQYRVVWRLVHPGPASLLTGWRVG